MHSLLDGLLTDDQLMELGKIRVALDKIDNAIERVNKMIKHTGLDIRTIEYEHRLPGNDISKLVYASCQAEKAITGAAQITNHLQNKSE
jgi:hypothetical protein